MNTSADEYREDRRADDRSGVEEPRADPVLLGLAKVLAPNPSVMTGQGTNTYLVGRDELAIIDPGPEDEHHLERLVTLATGRLRFILVTHHHADHAPLARRLADRTGASVCAFGHERLAAPDRFLRDGDVLDADGFSITALHTPGHASDHLCFLVSPHSDEWSVPLLFSGDHVMSGSTVVIAPLDGDMTAYMHSLDRLLALDAGQFAIAPGHGGIIEDGPSKLRAYLAHRYEREEMVLHALEKGPASAEELVPLVYSRLAVSLLSPAASSVWAHLRRLGDLGRATTNQPDDPRALWQLI